MPINFKIVPSPAPPGASVQLTAVEIVAGNFGINEGTVSLVCRNGVEEPLQIDSWLPFGVEATLPPTAPGPGPYAIRVRTAPPLDDEGSSDFELSDQPAG